MRHKRENPLLFERDGDFNPGWLVLIALYAVGCAGALVAFVEAVLHPAHDVLVLGLGFGFLTVGMLLVAIIIVPLAKAKLLSPALDHAIGEAGDATKAVVEKFVPHEWAKGDPDAGVA